MSIQWPRSMLVWRKKAPILHFSWCLLNCKFLDNCIIFIPLSQPVQCHASDRYWINLCCIECIMRLICLFPPKGNSEQASQKHFQQCPQHCNHGRIFYDDVTPVEYQADFDVFIVKNGGLLERAPLRKSGDFNFSPGTTFLWHHR